MAKKVYVKLKNAKAVKAGSTHKKDTGGIFNAKVAMIVSNLKNKKNG